MTKCIECQGEGGHTYGHYDQGWSTCRYCEGTGKQIYSRCKECNKFGEILSKTEFDVFGYPKLVPCLTCEGKKTITLDNDNKDKPYLEID